MRFGDGGVIMCFFRRLERVVYRFFFLSVYSCEGRDFVRYRVVRVSE